MDNPRARDNSAFASERNRMPASAPPEVRPHAFFYRVARGEYRQWVPYDERDYSGTKNNIAFGFREEMHHIVRDETKRGKRVVPGEITAAHI